MRYIFAYGSLLNPSSMAKTLPQRSPLDCFVAACRGFRRRFDVAFPNDGSQSDKAYFDESGRRPEFVLMANMVPATGSINGICIPVSESDLELLEARELRYELEDISDLTLGVPAERTGTVLAFLGRPQFTRGKDVARGVVSREYWETIQNGSIYWEDRSHGFLAHFQQSTDVPEVVIQLNRVDST